MNPYHQRRRCGRSRHPYIQQEWPVSRSNGIGRSCQQFLLRSGKLRFWDGSDRASSRKQCSAGSDLGVSRRAKRIQPEECGADHRGFINDQQVGARSVGRQTPRDSFQQLGISRSEHAPSEHHIDGLIAQIEPIEGSPSEQENLLSQPLHRGHGGPVAGRRDSEEHQSQFMESAAPHLTEVQRRCHVHDR